MRWHFASGQSIGASPPAEYSGSISFRIDWLDLLAIQGSLKSPLQHHSLKASILQHSAFFMAQVSHPYMTTGQTISLTRQTFVGKLMSLLFNMLSRLVIAFLPKSKCLLISWLQSPSAVMVEIPISSPSNLSTGTPVEISQMSWRMTIDYHKPNCCLHDRCGVFARED